MSTKKTIAKSFTVCTIEDGVSVQAQYAPNANPTSGQIHTVWQNGDLYMRTRESDESAWSSWHKIVGESGDETDFSFGISQYKTTANASTAPSDISSWSDAPLAVTTAKPYLWAKVQQKSWNASTQAYVVDSTRYIRLTGEDGYTVEAQYAPNNNPTSSQIHTTWQDGDLYMRTKQSNETTWSSWHKIVGESGDETDYTFNISKSLTSTNATTAPANCYYNTWQDAPVAPTSTYPYLWMKIVKKTWNESTQSYDSGTARYARITGEPGTSPYFADLDNEMDSIACTHDGKAASAQSVVTHVSMFKGSSAEAFTVDKIYRNGTQMSWDGNNNGVWPRCSGGTVTLEFDSGAVVNIKDDFKITLYATNATSVTRELHFIVNGIRANAIYRLVPSHSQIVKKKDGTYVPSGNVTCSVEKTENGSTSTPSSSEYTLEKSVNGGSYTTYSATAASSITSDLKFRLTVGGVVVDLETIPLVSDGDKGNTGDSAPYIELSRSTILYQANNDGYSIASQNFAITYFLKVKGNTCTISSTSSISISLPSNVTVVSGTKTTSGCTINCTHSKIMSGVITITITGTYDGVTYTATGTITVDSSRQGEQGDPGEPGEPGDPGERGKVGRFFYYAGEWNDFASTDSFLVNDAQAPYFYYNNNYWVFNPETNGTYTKQNMGTPSSSSSNWNLMTSDFKYIITEAIFGAYAHFGSFIINGDWLLSTNGKVGESVVSGESNISGSVVGGASFSVKAVTLFDSAYPSDGMVDIAYENNTVTIATSETTKQIMTVYLSASLTYRVSCDYSRSSGGSFYVRIRHASYGSVTPIYLPNTSGSASGNFRVTTSGTYIVEIYAASTGYTASVWNTVVSRLLFAPMYAVDGKTGASFQGGNGVFRGFVRKQKTRITTSNIDQYKRTDITSATVLDFDKCGSFIELATGTYGYVTLPLMSDYLASRYTSKQIDDIRSFVGTTMLIYNKSGQNIPMTLRYNSDGSTTSGTLHNGNCVELECCLDADANDGKEIIYWKVISYAEPVV